MRQSYLIVLLASTLAVTGAATGQTGQDACDKERDVSAKALPESLYKQLSNTYEDIGEEKYQSAYDDLTDLLDRTNEGTYSRAIVYQALGHTTSAMERFDEALDYFQRSVDIDALPNRQHFQMMYQIAQLLVMRERYAEGLDRLEDWFCVVPEDQVEASAYVLKASASAQIDRHRDALSAITKAIEMSDDPKESWYQTKLAMHYELEQYPEAASTLQVMVTRWPDKESYWKQLSSIYLELEDQEQALSVLALAYRKGMLDTQQELKQLSSLYQAQDLPYKAGKVLQKGLEEGIIESNRKQWEQAANAWYQAQELDEALAAYERAGRHADSGEIDLRRAFILIDRQRWEQAASALQRALEKGDLGRGDTGNAYLLLGMAQLNLERFDAAKESFGRATAFDKTRNAAEHWLGQVEQKRQLG